MGRLSLRGLGPGHPQPVDRIAGPSTPGATGVAAPPEATGVAAPPGPTAPPLAMEADPVPSPSRRGDASDAPSGPTAHVDEDPGESSGDRPSPPAELPVTISATTVERSAWSLVWLTVLIGGLGFWAAWSAWPFAAVVAPLLVLAGIGGLAASWLVRSPRSPLLQLLALASVVGSVLGPQAVATHVRQYYTTDSAAFNQVAARLLLHGKNPYTATMASATHLLQHPANNWTYTVSGGYVDHVSYPAGSFLLQVPALALGFNHAVVDWMDIFAWIATGVLIFALVPASLRWIGCLLLSIPIFAAIFGSGGTDAAFLPFLVLAVWRWDRFSLGRPAGLVRWMSPIALGLACSIKQTPWFCIPFLLLGVFIEARHAGRRPLWPTVTYLAATVSVFLAVNLPFIVWQPGAWAQGTLLPFAQPLVADGQGLVTLVLHGFAHGVSLPLLTAAGVLAFISLLAAFVAAYPAMKRIWLIRTPQTRNSLGQYSVGKRADPVDAALCREVERDATAPHTDLVAQQCRGTVGAVLFDVFLAAHPEHPVIEHAQMSRRSRWRSGLWGSSHPATSREVPSAIPAPSRLRLR